MNAIKATRTDLAFQSVNSVSPETPNPSVIYVTFVRDGIRNDLVRFVAIFNFFDDWRDVIVANFSA